MRTGSSADGREHGGRRAPSLAEQQTIEDALRALTRILYAAVERRHHALALDINISTRY